MHSYFKKGKDRLLACGQQQKKKSLESEVNLRAAAAASPEVAKLECADEQSPISKLKVWELKSTMQQQRKTFLSQKVS